MAYWEHGPVDLEHDRLAARSRGLEAERDFFESQAERYGQKLNDAEKEIRRLKDTGNGAPLALPGDTADLVEFLRTGKKIQAIKLVRERLGLGLKQAKDTVDAMMVLFYPGIYSSSVNPDGSINAHFDRAALS